jgi:eukaryotic-like serine/threonine-protein kinase
MQLPARIGKYELEEFLGGGMSHVYRARDTVIGRTVAVKVLTDAGCQDPEVKARFLAEARMAGNLVHDNILSIYDFGADEQNRPFMVMEFLRGEDLRQAIKNNHTGDLKSKLKIALQVARALEYIHSQKIVHRDIKPENAHINTAGVVKLMDFGIAKTEGLAMTRAGYVLGTPYYMAPEQVTGQGITGQVDVYAFGVLLFEVLTGLKPISGETVERIFYSILNEPISLEPLQAAGVPESVCDLVAQCTRKNPAERPQGFAPVCAGLEKILAGFEPTTVAMPANQPVTPVTPPAGRPAWIIPAILAGVVALGLAGYFTFGSKKNVVSAPPAPAGPALAKSVSTPAGEMLLVSAGDFKYGPNPETVSLPAFYVDKTEVTNQAYLDFCNQTKRPLPADFPKDKPEYPVVNVSILDAQKFAAWAGKRLPTAREWEKAARGGDGRLFTWGNEPDPTRANVADGETHTPALRPAGDFSSGASPYGALQMIGNVWELVDQLSEPGKNAIEYFERTLKPKPGPDEGWYTIRGQSFSDKLDKGALYDFTTVPARWKNSNIGFRCVKDAR